MCYFICLLLWRVSALKINYNFKSIEVTWRYSHFSSYICTLIFYLVPYYIECTFSVCIHSNSLMWQTYTDNLYELSSFSTHWILHITWIVKGTVNIVTTIKNAKLITRRIKFTLPPLQRKQYPVHSSLEDGNYTVYTVPNLLISTLLIITHNYKTFARLINKMLKKNMNKLLSICQSKLFLLLSTFSCSLA